MNTFPLTPAFPEREYLSCGVNMSTNTLKIPGTSKTAFFELISFQIFQKILQKHCRADLSSDSDPLNPLTC